MSDKIRLILTAVFLLAGVLSILTAVFGVYRFRFILNRMHAAALIDTFGLSLILIGLMIAAGTLEYIPKILLILLFQWIGSPIASHFVARLELNTDKELEQYTDREDDTVSPDSSEKAR